MQRFIGIDLSGPGSAQNTAVAVFRPADAALELTELVAGADDATILRLMPQSGVVGLDAPLSYSPVGGSREADRALRQEARQSGLAPGAVMAPSAPRMVYLTLRGIAVSRCIASECPRVSIVEVHPTACLALRGAPIESVRGMKTAPRARQELLEWLEAKGLRGLGGLPEQNDHSVAACAAALAAWKWSTEKSVWLHKAEPPLHPFDYAC